MIASRTFGNEPASVRLARKFVAEHLPEDLGSDADAVTLMVSELATNSARHATMKFTVTVDIDDQRLQVAVADDGPGTPQVRSPSSSDVHGRGLRIVSELSDEWGFTSSPGHGTVVWFTVQFGRQRSGAEPFSNRSGISADGWVPRDGHRAPPPSGTESPASQRGGASR